MHSGFSILFYFMFHIYFSPFHFHIYFAFSLMRFICNDIQVQVSCIQKKEKCFKCTWPLILFVVCVIRCLGTHNKCVLIRIFWFWFWFIRYPDKRDSDEAVAAYIEACGEPLKELSLNHVDEVPSFNISLFQSFIIFELVICII